MQLINIHLLLALDFDIWRIGKSLILVFMLEISSLLLLEVSAALEKA